MADKEICPNCKEGYEDAQFIVLSREALPYWIERAEAAERAVERLLDALDHGARCPQPGMWDACHDYSSDAKCRACRKAWAMGGSDDDKP
jgi:hypothetical protein